MFFIRYNGDSNSWKYPEITGKALFWCWLHQGAWPRWLHQMHMIYVIYGEEQINCFDVLREYLPHIYGFVMDLQSNLRNNELLSLWATNINKSVCNFKIVFFLVYKKY